MNAEYSQTATVFELVNKRFRMQNLADASFHGGWVKDAYDNTLAANLVTEKALKHGDFYYMEIEGPGYMATCIIWVNSLNGTEFEATLASPIERKDLQREFRVTLESTTGAIIRDGGSVPVNIIDVSKSGMAFLTSETYRIGSHIILEMMVNSGVVRFDAEVRSCRMVGGDLSLNRIGVLIGTLSRVAQARWQQFLQSLQ